VPNDYIRKQDRRKYRRGMHKTAQHHPNDSERGLRIPRRDVERADRINVTGPVEHHVARRKNSRILQIAKEFHRRTASCGATSC
jgi:hypothetical protein